MSDLLESGIILASQVDLFSDLSDKPTEMIMETKQLNTSGEKYSMSLSGHRQSETDCGDCLDLRKVFSSRSPKISVWSALEEAAKYHRAPKKTKSTSKTTKEPKYLCLLILGSILSTLGLLSLIWTPFDILLNERLRMMPGLPAYEWWQAPPDEVLLSAYVFNYTNSQEFMEGKADKLEIQEVGPYYFREKLYHNDVEFHDNGTLSYTALRQAIFLPEMNTLSLNDSITVPNLAVLGAASFLAKAPFITKIGLKMLINQAGSPAFATVPVDTYFWNMTDPVLQLGRSLLPSLVPTNNVGILHQIYQHFEDRVTVKIGSENGQREFFKIQKYNGDNGMQMWENETCDSVQGSSEGVSYHQNIYKNDTVYYLRKTICRAVPLYFIKEVVINGILAYKFELPNTTFARPPEGQQECYRDAAYPLLPTGLSDVSPCYYNFPIASSFPHFMYTDQSVTEKLSGLSPDWEKHGSAAIIEPNTGVPLTAWARSQSSLVMQSMSSFPQYKRFSNMALPMFWLEYKQEGLPAKITFLLYFSVNIIKTTQFYFSLLSILAGFACYVIALRRIQKQCSNRRVTTVYHSIENIRARKFSQV